MLLKPSHALRLLAEDADAKRGGFSPQAEYIFHKQLEEADYLLITRSDQLSEQQIDSLKHLLAKAAARRSCLCCCRPESRWFGQRYRLH